MATDKSPSRMDLRKQRTRAALIKAAQTFIANGQLEVPVQDISQAADVGVGSFYNHFDSKEELFQAAVNDVIEAQGALLDALTDAIEDPAEKFAARYRLTGRLFRLRPKESRIGLALGMQLIMADKGLGPRGVRDIGAAAAAGRFTVTDPELAMVLGAGSLLALGQLLHDQPDRDDAKTVDEVTEGLLRLFGMPADEAVRISRVPLPDLAWVGDVDLDQLS
ncbi:MULTISPECIES: TetR/AcrR family transcriptional regulator [unclassified Mycobacterium]|uniref:TetR/AcrR family transcriptional regulator n=1 Tax=unclassified Mycobacterium TaxID=2642494 RepID=UPI002741F5E9|nr:MULTISPECIES: TetR/AcrR family transcriptional regulator [unclassified Mycobacterium]MDP7703591.1 TetR/AcrR family transcriptional regulator [Mycobacterium sp. TY815]MDP7722073.1 TetR/AcrR family transcriptional regulator [Mycobacterium sp. TY814]